MRSFIEKIQASFPLLMAWLYKKKRLTPDMLAEPEAADFIEKMTAGFNAAVDKSIRIQPLDDISRRRLQESNYIFSGIKTFHELNEAFPSMLDKEGNVKPFEHFLNDVQSINNTYNGSYLRTEYNFARNASLMAAKWKEFEADGDRYHLQYRTAGDERVRASHRRLNNITLPITSRFWDDYLPPNGYGCRCTVVQVRKGKYPLSDEREALNLASQATAGKHQEMMKFNPGKEMTTFPAYNAYTRSKCKSCKNRPGNISLAADIPSNELCAACKVVREEQQNKNRKLEQQRIEQNKALYDKLSKDKRYKNVEFNNANGALKATHVGHNEGRDQGFKLEKKLIDSLYEHGHSVILLDEQKKGKDGQTLSSLDMALDGVTMDIRSITKDKPHYGSAINSKNKQLFKYNSRTDVHQKAETICLYFDDPSMFEPGKIKKGYEYMKAREANCKFIA